MQLPEALADLPPMALLAAVVLGLLVPLGLWATLSGPRAPDIDVELTAEELADTLEGPAHPKMELKDPSRPGWIQCYDPATLQRLGEVEAMTPERVEAMIARAKLAQLTWATTSFAERKRVLWTMQKYITKHVHEIVRVASRDSGKPLLDALLGEVLTTCEKIRCVCAEGDKWLRRDKRPNGPLMMHKTSYVEYHPLGVLGVIAPWNYPFHNAMNHVISGLFAGNAVVSKVSEYTSWSSAYYSRIMQTALQACGHDPDLVQVITGFGEAGAALVASDNIDKIIFTGSPGVGRKVMQGAAPHLKPVILELGGKDPLVICEDANLDEVIPMVMRGCFQNAGQNCCGIERVVCYEGILEKFVEKVRPMVEALSQGPALGHGHFDVGAMVVPRQLEIIQELVDDAVANGAELLVGGKRNADWPNGNFYQPTMLVGVTNAMRIAKEEVFGPVMAIVTVPGDNDDAAVALVNDCDFGLGAAVFSAHQTRATQIGERIRCGMTTVNDFGVNYLVQSLPFGGVKESGFDRFAGPEGLRACCLVKSVVVDKFSWCRTSIPKPLQYPIAPTVGLDFGKAMVGLMYNDGILGRISALVAITKASMGMASS